MHPDLIGNEVGGKLRNENLFYFLFIYKYIISFFLIKIK
jgi:hypothetical protein